MGRQRFSYEGLPEKKVVSVVLALQPSLIEFEGKPAGILGVNKVAIRFRKRSDASHDGCFYLDYGNLSLPIHFFKWTE